MTMGQKTSIQWTEATWNPIRGCSRVSQGCVNCYAEKVAKRFSGPGQPYEGLVDAKGRWNGTVRMVPEHLGDPLRWKRPRMVFVNSMSDLFHESLTNEQIATVFGVMAASPQHTFQVLTKRPKRMLAWFRWASDSPVETCAFMALNELEANGHGDTFATKIQHAHDGAEWPLPNVWLGVSVEDQKTADERIPLLLQCPAAVRWVSYEPALGPVDFRGLSCTTINQHRESDRYDAVGGLPWWSDNRAGVIHGRGPALDWIVVGGESGPGARSFNLAWAEDVIAQVIGTGCRMFVKQLGARPVNLPEGCVIRDRKGGDMAEWPAHLRVREWPEVEP